MPEKYSFQPAPKPLPSIALDIAFTRPPIKPPVCKSLTALNTVFIPNVPFWISVTIVVTALTIGSTTIPTTLTTKPATVSHVLANHPLFIVILEIFLFSSIVPFQLNHPPISIFPLLYVPPNTESPFFNSIPFNENVLFLTSTPFQLCPPLIVPVMVNSWFKLALKFPSLTSFIVAGLNLYVAFTVILPDSKLVSNILPAKA